MNYKRANVLKKLMMIILLWIFLCENFETFIKIYDQYYTF